MWRYLFLIITLCSVLKVKSQLKDIKIMIPKDIGYSYYDFMQFFPDEKLFVVCANSLAVHNTETAEVIDEVDLTYGAKNLSVSKDGKHILVSLNNELHIYSFVDQKLNLEFKTNTAELINGQPNSQYYSSLPIGGCFFTNKANEVYVSIGSFTLLYNYFQKSVSASYAFPITDYIINSAFNEKKQEVVHSVSSGTTTAIIKQSISNLSETTNLDLKSGMLTKMRIKDSLMFCFSTYSYFILNLDNNKVIHEVRLPKYESYGMYDPGLLKDINKRPFIIKPDTLNFSPNEYVYDIDYIAKSGQAVYATSKAVKFIDLKTKKITRLFNGVSTNLKSSQAGNRLVTVSYLPYKALRIFDPSNMKLIAERATMGSPINAASISPNNRWLYTSGTTAGYFWDLKNFSKYAEIKDISGSDSAYIYNVYFLNDSEVVVNSGKTFSNLNLAVYNIHKKKYGKIIKKNTYAITSGFMNGEFYYCDYASLHIINLKTLKEEKYEGLFSLAASPLYQIVQFNKEQVFVPEASKFKLVNRKTKQTDYESQAWSVNSRVTLSDDGKYLYTASQITKKKNINGVDVDMPTNAIVKIDIARKTIVQDYAQTYFPYDFKIKKDGKVIAIWYVKYDVGNYNSGEQEVFYTEYDTETGKEMLSKNLAKTKDIISFHQTSETGKYFALMTVYGDFFKVFDDKGDLVIDLSGSKFAIPKCFFIENLNKLIITSTNNSLATFIDLDKKEIIGQLANATGDNFFLVTSDLHYLGSKDFVKNIRFKYQTEIYSFEQFDAYLNQPHKVLKTFNCSDTALISAYEKAYLKRMRILGLSPESKINFSILPTIPLLKMQEEKPGWINFSMAANKGKNKLTRLQVLNNGTQIYNENIPFDLSTHFEKTLSFETTSGINRFEFIVYDDQGLESPRVSRFYNNTNIVKPNLYLAVIASEKFHDPDYDLSYAVKDATDIASTMSNSKSFEHVEIKKLFNQSFSADSVKNLKSFFSKAGVNDVVMVFLAGHGYLDADLSYYFPTYYTDFNDPKINSVAYTAFEKLFQDMKPIRKLMFIDACFSGEADDEGEFNRANDGKNKKENNRAIRIAGSSFSQSTALEMSKSIFSDLRQNSGATIISSAGGTQTALESESWNNGLFTHCLIDALTKLKADENKDKKITLSELQKFVSEEVYKLSNGNQTPTYRVENNVLDYELW